jgi:hypothetical protein
MQVRLHLIHHIRALVWGLLISFFKVTLHGLLPFVRVQLLPMLEHKCLILLLVMQLSLILSYVFLPKSLDKHNLTLCRFSPSCILFGPLFPLNQF